MTLDELRVKFKNGEPVDIKAGRGYFGDPVAKASMRSMDDGKALVMFDKLGSRDFEKMLLELPFVDEVIRPDNSDADGDA
ncbi:hypothetical protein EGH21_22480 [Halomicroarcula sp. F13]|uniref:Uncharacterized protein n=1 Tax=Haloarcula rubra TaxID=2487747 RepID=A0AAW4PXN6_9EURY|nr:hypothetical protein [Halomicroarcula rubra]MBX0325788.1 hypothetical protein [Halomicroarcula rubra]